jgi:hypothetical protein
MEHQETQHDHQAGDEGSDVENLRCRGLDGLVERRAAGPYDHRAHTNSPECGVLSENELVLHVEDRGSIGVPLGDLESGIAKELTHPVGLAVRHDPPIVVDDGSLHDVGILEDMVQRCGDLGVVLAQ